MKFYQLTGDKRFLSGIPSAISWLEETVLPENQAEKGHTHPTFVEIGTNRPIYVHRKGSNVKYGSYYVDYNDDKLLAHYSGKGRIDIQALKDEFNRVSELSLEEATKGSPLKIEKFKEDGTPQSYYNLNRSSFSSKVDNKKIAKILTSIDDQNRWLTSNVSISNPYIGDGKKQEQTDEYASTRVGDETDTSPYPNNTNQKYISTRDYIANMKYLIGYFQSTK
jgi:hypothetical protein